MNLLLWTLQCALAMFAFAGGAYKLFQFDQLAQMPQTAALSRAGWGAIGVFEMLCAILLILPAATRWMPRLTPLAAVALALESLALAVLDAQYSLAIASNNPLLYVIAMGAVAAFVAWGRYSLRPLA